MIRGTTWVILNCDHRGMTGCSDIAFDTIRSTCGSRPDTADNAKLLEPWQWIRAFTVSAPVLSMMHATARGWSSTAA